MATWPSRNQQAPDFWDTQLRTYIDEPDAANATAAAAALSKANESYSVAVPAYQMGDQALTAAQGKAPIRATINAQTTDYTPVLADENALITMTSSSARIITVPANGSTTFPVGARIDLVRMGSGTVTISGGVGVTVNATPGFALRAQYSAASLIKIATNTWLLIGDLA